MTGSATGRGLWRIAVTVPAAATEAFAEALGEGAAAVATFEADEDGISWLVEATWTTPPDRGDLAARVAILAQACGIDEPGLAVEPVREADWLEESLTSFPPRRIGRFWVHGPHIRSPAPAGALPLEVAAATAFGSGEHASTRGCLLALGRLARGRRAAPGWRGLDCGCGSGILALAMAKLQRRPVLAVDLDPEAVRVTARNARINGVGALVRARYSDGTASAAVRRAAPFDCIAANILARPLARMAPALAAVLKPGGVVVLAGLLVRHESLVLAAHRRAGLRLVGRLRLEGWSTLVVERPTRTTGHFPGAVDRGR